MNPLFSIMENRNQQPNLFEQFNKFKMGLNGDPKQIVENMLATGQMSQEQFNQLSSMARSFQQFLK